MRGLPDQPGSDLLHRPIAAVDELGYRVACPTAISARFTQHQDEAGYITSHAFDPRGNWTGTVSPMGQTHHSHV